MPTQPRKLVLCTPNAFILSHIYIVSQPTQYPGGHPTCSTFALTVLGLCILILIISSYHTLIIILSTPRPVLISQDDSPTSSLLTPGNHPHISLSEGSLSHTFLQLNPLDFDVCSNKRKDAQRTPQPACTFLSLLYYSRPDPPPTPVCVSVHTKLPRLLFPHTHPPPLGFTHTQYISCSGKIGSSLFSRLHSTRLAPTASFSPGRAQGLSSLGEAWSFFAQLGRSLLSPCSQAGGSTKKKAGGRSAA